MEDVDTDKDEVMDCKDECPEDMSKTEPGVCGCGKADDDRDNDGVQDCVDGCPDDMSKTDPGVCGCGVEDKDTDGDGALDCIEECPMDKDKTEPGFCGCGMSDVDTDGDMYPDCIDGCPNDSAKYMSDFCGCGSADVDTDLDGFYDCLDGCPADPLKTEPGVCGCGLPDVDTDGDEVPDCKDECPYNKTKTMIGVCGCNVTDTDRDSDGVLDCQDSCPEDMSKTTPGKCGCGVSDVDTDNDGAVDCEDLCPNDPLKTALGSCGCGVPDTDTNNNGVPDCNEKERGLIIPNETDTNHTNHSGGGYGDPHLKTWTGLVYDFHGECDLVLVKSESFDNGQGLALHIRTTMRHDWSFISAAALCIGDGILEVCSKSMYWLNGVASALLPANIAGFPIELEHYGNLRHHFLINLGQMGKVVIKVFNEFLAVEVENANEDGFGDSVGLMGTFDGGHLMSREGRKLSDYAEFGMDWQVRDTEPMLFQEAVGPQYPQPCRMPSAAAMKRRARRLSEAKVSLEQATKACRNWAEESRESCIYDVMSTGDLEMALSGF